MNLAEIETFLTIVNTKSITKTSEILFLSQPTVSHRLQALEEELQFPLIIRKKGHKQVELTPKGQEFIPIAERWMSLWKETQILKQGQDRIYLTIGCTDSLNISLLAPFYLKILDADQKIDLSIRTHQSSEIYTLLNNHEIDIGFVYHHLHYKNIITEKVMSEKMYLVQSQEPAVRKPLIHTNELDPTKELFLSWDDNFQFWHDRWFPSVSRPHISVDTITLLNRLWKDPANWLIAPKFVIMELAKYRPLFVSEIENCPPDHVCYKAKHRMPKFSNEQLLQFFEEQLSEYLADCQRPVPVGEVFSSADLKPKLLS